ncbi:MAG: hypothetical protein WCV85_00505 [Patescibacteria group bacterium]|jgi:hypothetical protein
MYKPTGFIALPTLGLLILVAAGIAFASWWFAGREEAVAPTISNFTECAAAGNPVMESYPRQCNANGQNFVEVIVNTNAVVNENVPGEAGSGSAGNVGVNSNTNAATNTNVAVNGNTNIVADPTAGWKTYTSTTHGFSLKYPTTMRVLEVNETNGIILRVGVAGSSNGDNILIYNKSANSGIPYSTVKTGNGRTFVISHVGTEADLILSTFTILDATKNWNEFTNKPWGFSFKYPKEWKVLQNSIQAIDTMGLPENVLKIGASPRPIFVLYVDPMGWGVGNVHYAMTVKKQNDKFIIVEGKPTGAKTGEFGLSEYYSVSVRQENAENPRIYISFHSAIKAEESAEFNSLVRQIISTFTFTK